MDVIFLDNPVFDSVAVVNRSTGIIMVNAPLFAGYTPFEQRFILLHEEGHYVLDTDCEFTADAYAFDRLAGTEFRSLRQLVATLERTLPFTTREHRERVNAQLRRALKWDYEHGNREAGRMLARLNAGYSAMTGTEDKLLGAVADDINNRNATNVNGWLSNFSKLSQQQKMLAGGAIAAGVLALIIITR